jgi:hypothetical protein
MSKGRYRAAVGAPVGGAGSAAAPFTADSVANLAHWYKPELDVLFQDSGMVTPVASDGDPVGAWVCQIVGADEILQATPGARPAYRASVAAFNNRPALQFDGDDFLKGAFSAPLSQPTTIFLVAQTALGTTVMSDGDDSGHRQVIWTSGGNWAIAAPTSVVGSAGDTDSHILTATFNGPLSTLHVDGVLVASGDPGAHALDGLTLGGQYGGVAQFTGHVPEELIFNADLNSADKNIVQNYLSAKYGISVTEFSPELAFAVTTTSDPETVTLTRITPTGQDVTIDWGDGNSDTISDGNTGTITHQYATAGTYAVRISDPSVITYIDINGVNGSGDLSGWDVSSATTIYLYSNSFSGDLSGWDVSSATVINLGSNSFSGDLSGWDVSSAAVISLYSNSFSGDLSGWDVSSATIIYLGGNSFSGDLSGWDVSSATTIYLYSNSFSGDLSGWDVSSATIIHLYGNSFSGDLSGWDVSSAAYIHLYGNSFSGDPGLPANGLTYYNIANNSLSLADVDSIINTLWGNRANWTDATPELHIGGTNATPTGAYQDGYPVPLDALEQVHDLISDDNSDGIQTWAAISWNGGSAP